MYDGLQKSSLILVVHSFISVEDCVGILWPLQTLSCLYAKRSQMLEGYPSLGGYLLVETELRNVSRLLSKQSLTFSRTEPDWDFFPPFGTLHWRVLKGTTESSMGLLGFSLPALSPVIGISLELLSLQWTSNPPWKGTNPYDLEEISNSNTNHCSLMP